MTRKECEQRIEEKLLEIANIYKEYHSEGKYLTMCYIEDEDGYSIMFNNRCWAKDEDDEDDEAGEDYLAGKIIDFHKSFDDEEEDADEE